jgi:two-component system CheB/CheR fusion protein
MLAGWTDIVHPDDLPALLEAWGPAMDEGRPLEIEYRLLRHDGTYRWHSDRTIPLRDQHGDVSDWLSVDTDIHDLKRAEAERERLLTELRNALAAKDEFLGIISHELRTPITTILGNAEVLARRGDALDPQMRSAALQDVAHEAERLSRIVDNLLTLARIERHQHVETEPIILRRIAERVVLSHRRQFPYREIELDLDDGVPALGDATSVEQVLRNFLSNAEKYSPVDTPITVGIAHDGGDVLGWIGDRGDGIPEEEADSIFTPFYRSPRTAEHAAGAGIGLAVCKKLIEAQGGRIWARARDGGGSEFGFALPATSIDVDGG